MMDLNKAETALYRKIYNAHLTQLRERLHMTFQTILTFTPRELVDVQRAAGKAALAVWFDHQRSYVSQSGVQNMSNVVDERFPYPKRTRPRVLTLDDGNQWMYEAYTMPGGGAKTTAWKSVSGPRMVAATPLTITSTAGDYRRAADVMESPNEEVEG